MAAKVTPEILAEIRHLYFVEDVSVPELARLYEVDPGTIRRWIDRAGEPLRG